MERGVGGAMSDCCLPYGTTSEAGASFRFETIGIGGTDDGIDGGTDSVGEELLQNDMAGMTIAGNSWDEEPTEVGCAVHGEELRTSMTESGQAKLAVRSREARSREVE